MALDRRNEGTALRTDVPDSRVPAAWNLEPLHGFEPRVEQWVASSESADRLFDVVWASRHAPKLTRLRSKTVAPRIVRANTAPLRLLATRPAPGMRTSDFRTQVSFAQQTHLRPLRTEGANNCGGNSDVDGKNTDDHPSFRRL